MLVIALTGGICSGKTAASTRFKQLGIPVIDADIISREITGINSPALKSITNTFGDSVLQADGSLNRKKLGSIIFSDNNRRQQLEAILHPLIRSEMKRQLSRLSSPYAILSIPLLAETGQQTLADRVLVIDATENTQRRRLKLRDALSDKDIDNILNAQTSRQARLAIADDIIVNESSIEHLNREINKLHQYYMKTSGINEPLPS